MAEETKADQPESQTQAPPPAQPPAQSATQPQQRPPRPEGRGGGGSGDKGGDKGRGARPGGGGGGDRGPRPSGGGDRGGGDRGGGDRGPRPGGEHRGGGEQRGSDRGDRGGRDSRDRGDRGHFGPPMEIDLEKLIADSLYLDNQAHNVVARIGNLDSGTKSQLRRLYNAVRRATRAAEGERQHEFVMLRARLAYTIARHSLRSLDQIERLLLQVTRKNEARGYERFRDLFEAIVAYNE